MRNRFRNVSFLSDGFYDNYIPFMPKNQVFSVIFRLLIFELPSARPPFFENEKASDNKKTIPNKNLIGCIAKSAFFSFFISAAAFVIIINILTTI